MLFSQNVTSRSTRPSLVLSLATHAFLLACVLAAALHTGRVRPVYHESRCCTAALVWNGVQSTGMLKPQRRQQHQPTPPRPTTHALTAPVPPVADAAEQPAAIASQQAPTLGTGTGTDNAEPALPVFFPRPPVPDRALLPPAEQNVIVDVDISAMGEVTGEKLVRGLGNGLDEVVLNTVRSWKFKPATLNGTAIASAEELVFPFSQNSSENDG